MKDVFFPSFMSIMGLLIFLVVYSSSCSTATAREPVKDSSGFIHSFDNRRCQSLLDQRDALSWGIAFATGLSAAGGVTTAGIDTGSESKDKQLRWGFGISTAILGAAGSSMMVLVKLKSSEFELYCNQVPIVVPIEKVDPIILPVNDVYVGDAGIE